MPRRGARGAHAGRRCTRAGAQQQRADCCTPRAGHTLRLLHFPTLLEKGLTKVMALRGTVGGMMSGVTRLMGGAGMALPGLDENLPDRLMGRLENMLGVVRTVNAQFKDPGATTFVCVCIPEFLSLYETERLVQELAKCEIDVRNIIINQVIFPEAGAQ